MEVAVIIPTKNEEKFLPYLLKELKEQTYQNFKIFVADANSKDKTKKIAKKYGATVVKGGLPAIARDNGAKEAIKKGAKILVFIDADVIIPNKEFVEKTLKEFKKRKLDLAGVNLSPSSTKERKKKSKDTRYILFYWIHNIIMNSNEKGKRPFMQNYMISKIEAYKKSGGFGNLEFGEDSEFSKKAVEKGYKFGVLKTAGNVLISPRRFVEKGFWKMTVLYLYLNARVLLGHKFVIKKENIYFDK